MKRILIVGTVVLAGAAACGKSEEQKAAEQTTAAAQQIAKGAEQMAQGAQGTAQSAQQGMAQMMQGLQQMGQAQNGGKPVQVVDYEKLKELLPEFAGWERSNVKGSQQSMGISVSTAEARYKKGDASMTLKIMDSSLSQALLAPIMMLGSNFSERSDDGYKKGINLNGMQGMEEWRKDGKHGEVSVVVGNRFLVQAEGDDVDSADVPRSLVQAVNLQKLAALK